MIRRLPVPPVLPALLIAALVALAAPAAAQDGGRVRGEVRTEETRRPIAGAAVELVGGGARSLVQTDSLGRYRLMRVPAGRHQLKVRHLAHAPFEVEVIVPAGGEVVVDVALRTEPLVLAPINVEVGRVPSSLDTVAAPAPELVKAATRSLEATPGLSELGLTNPRGVPGQEPVDPSDVLFVRGAAADLKLVLLDGAPVYSPFHLGGLVSPFEPGLLRSVALHVGGAPARYDGGLAYIMELDTRAARRDRVHFTGGVDALMAGGTLEAPIGAAGVLLSARSVHALGVQAMLSEPLAYGYDEALARLDVEPARGHVLRTTLFGNRETVALHGLVPGDSTAHWSNLAASLRYRGRWGAHDAELTAALSEFDARLPLGGSQDLRADGGASRVRLHGELSRRFGAGDLRYGASLDRMALRTRLATATEGGDSVRMDERGDAVAGGVYVDTRHAVSPRLQLRGGLRADLFSLDPQPRLGPRLSATWLMSEGAALTLAAGRYHQQIRTSDSVWIAAAGRANLVELPPPVLTVAEATHVSLGLDQQFGEGVRLGLEGFYKRFGGMPEATSAAAAASGMDVWVRRDGALSGWLGYSLAWVWALPETGTASERFSGRQLLTLGASGPLSRLFDFELGFAYGAGLPFTAISFAAPPGDFADSRGNNETRSNLGGASETPPLATPPSDPYIRLDLTLSGTWRPEFNGTVHRLTPYVRVLNALDRRDSLFYRRQLGDGGTPRPLSPLPVLPVLGLSWAF